MAKKMTAEEILAANGFKAAAETALGIVYNRVWEREDEVLWYGKTRQSLEIRVMVRYGIPLVQVIRNGRCESRIRDYSTLGRAMRAICEIVRCADFEM